MQQAPVLASKIQQAAINNIEAIVKAMDESLSSIPPQYRQEGAIFLDEVLESFYEVDDFGLGRLTCRSHFIYLVTTDEIKEYDMGASDNEILVPYTDVLTIVIVAY